MAEVVPVLAGRADTTPQTKASNQEGNTMSTKTVLTEQLATQKAEADRIAASFKVDEKGRFDISSQQYADYRKAVANVKEIKGLIDDLDVVEEADNYLTAPVGTPEAAGDVTKRGNEFKSLGDLFLNSPEYKAFRQSGREYEGQRLMAEMEGKALHNLSVAPHTIPALGGGQDVGIFETQRRTFHVRDLFPKATTKAPVLYGLRESGFTNKAEYVSQTDRVPAPNTGWVSAPTSEVSLIPIMFPVAEIAHMMHAHKSILADDGRLKQFLNTRMTEGLKFREDQELLWGEGGAERITGIGKTSGVQKYTGLVTDKRSIQVRRAITQALLAEYDPTGLVVNPQDWEHLEVETDDTGAFRVAIQVAIGAEKKLWRLNVVETTAMKQGNFLLGSFGQGAQLYDREAIKVQVSTEHGTNFADGVVSLRADSRSALVVERPESFVVGTFTEPDPTAV